MRGSDLGWWRGGVALVEGRQRDGGAVVEQKQFPN